MRVLRLFPVRVEQEDPLVSPDGKSVRGDRFPVADAFEERVAGDDVFVFTCSCYFSIVRFKEEEQKRSQRTNPRHHPREERLQRTNTRDRIKKRTDLNRQLPRTGYGHRARFALLRGELRKRNTIITRTDFCRRLLVSSRVLLLFSSSSCSSSRGIVHLLFSFS